MSKKLKVTIKVIDNVARKHPDLRKFEREE